MSKEYDAAKEREFLLEVRDFYWQYLQEYAKKEDTPIEDVNGGIEVLMKLVCSDYMPIGHTDAQAAKPLDFGPGSPLRGLANFCEKQLASTAKHKNT